MSKLIAFAMDFASYLMQHVEIGKVDEILLFGSVARGDAGKKSDVDKRFLHWLIPFTHRRDLPDIGNYSGLKI